MKTDVVVECSSGRFAKLWTKFPVGVEGQGNIRIKFVNGWYVGVKVGEKGGFGRIVSLLKLSVNVDGGTQIFDG